MYIGRQGDARLHRVDDQALADQVQPGHMVRALEGRGDLVSERLTLTRLLRKHPRTGAASAR